MNGFVGGKHVHRWSIATPDGPTSDGTCFCGVTRTFYNTFADDGPSARLQRTLKRKVLPLAAPFRLLGRDKGLTR